MLVQLLEQALVLVRIRAEHLADGHGLIPGGHGAGLYPSSVATPPGFEPDNGPNRVETPWSRQVRHYGVAVISPLRPSFTGATVRGELLERSGARHIVAHLDAAAAQ